MQTIQTSAFPDERPDEEIKCSLKKMRTGEVKLRAFLEKQGPYSFCKMAEEIRTKTPEYCKEKYNETPDGCFKMCERIFGEYVLWRETIASFLNKCKNIPAYNITKLINASKETKDRKKKTIKAGLVSRHGRKTKPNGEGLPG